MENNVIQFPLALMEAKPYPELSELEREQSRVALLVAYLDKHDPGWREKIKEMVE